MLSGSSLKFRTGTTTTTPKEKRPSHDQLVFSKSPTSVRTGTAHAKTGRTNSDNPDVVKTKSNLSMLRSSTREIITRTDEGSARKLTPCRARAQSGTKSSSKSLFDKAEPKMAVKHISRPKADPASPGTYLPPAHTATRLRSPVTPSTNTPLRTRSTAKFSSHSASSPIVSRCLMDHRDYQTGRKSKVAKKENAVCSYSPISSPALQRSSLILSGINTPKRSSSSIKKVGSESPIKAINVSRSQAYPYATPPNDKPSRLSMQNIQLQSPSTRDGKRISQTVLSSKRTPMNIETLTPKDKRSPRSPLRPLLLPLLIAQREGKLQYPYTPSEPGRVYISTSSSSPSSLPRRSSSMAYVAKARDPDANTLSAHGAMHTTPRKASPGRSRDEIHSHTSSATLLSKDGNAQRVSLNEENSETDYLADASFMKDNTRKNSPLQNRLAEIMIPFESLYDNIRTSEGVSESYTTQPILALCMIGSATSNTHDVIQRQRVDVCVQTDNIPELLYKKIVSYTSASVDTTDFDEYLAHVQQDKAKLDRSDNVKKLFKNGPHTASKPTSILRPKITNINTAPKHQNPPVMVAYGSNHRNSIPHSKPPHSTPTSKASKEKENIPNRDTQALQYRIRPPPHSNQTSTVKKNANAEIELELEYLRSRTKVAKGVVMLDRRVTIFGTGQCARDVKDIKEIKKARDRSSEGGEANVVDSDGEQLSLKALAILHRMKQNGKGKE